MTGAPELGALHQAAGERLAAVGEPAQDAIVIIDSAGIIAYCNPAAESLIGYSAERAAGKLAYERLVPEHARAAWAAALKEFAATGQTTALLKAAGTTAIREDGTEFPIELSLAATRLGGEWYAVADIGGVPRPERPDRNSIISERQLAAILDSLQAEIMIIDPDTHQIVDVNPAAARLFGAPKQTIVGVGCQKFVCPADVGKCPITDLHQEVDNSERVLITADGGRVPIIKTVAKAVLDDKTYLIEYFIDVTERKRAEAATVYRGLLMHALAEAGRELVMTTAIDEAIPRALRIMGDAVKVDRAVVLEAAVTGGGQRALMLRYCWNSPAAPVQLDSTVFAEIATPELEADLWFAPLAAGEPITNKLSLTTGLVKQLFERLAIRSTLIVPLMIDGKLWGQIGFDDCHDEREWREVESDILRTLADMVCTAMVRARYVQELADANVIIASSPTILYRLRGEPTLPMVYVSQNIRQYGYDPATMVASPHIYRTYVHPEDAEKVHEAMAAILAPDSQPSSFEYRILTADGGYRWVENHYTPVRDITGRLVELEGVLIDITERKQAEEKIALLARTDALTGLANRATFIDRLRRAFAVARRGGPAFGVFYLDLDHFKDVNDTLGHPAGDELLKAVAERIRSSLRETDLAARLGGDEFAILQTELADPVAAGALAHRLRSVLTAPYQIADSEVHVTASVGISLYTPDTIKPDDMLAQADLALYRAKDEGRDQFRYHTESLDVQLHERVALAEDLRGAIGRDEIELYYQPQVRIGSNEIVGLEALIRWHHPTRGLLQPDEFLQTAERAGVMVALGGWVLDHACQQMSEWRRDGIAPAILAVNLSLMQLRAGSECVDVVAQTLARWGLAPGELELDVTESMLAHATLAQNDVLERLQRLGVQIAIDDFGTQYSSLDYLRTYNVSRIKIPRPMISAATREPRSAAMVRAIIDIAHELDVEVVAQGVETEAQRNFLGETAATRMAQGFYYCEPVPADRATQLLRRKRIEPLAIATGGTRPA